MKTKLLTLTSLLLIGAGCQTTSPSSNLSQNSLNGESNTTVFCSPDGALTRTQTIQSHRSYCLQTQKTEPILNTPIDYSFAIIDDQGQKLTDFQTVHEKIMHVIVVRQDLQEFQHIHPEFDKTLGTFTLKNLTFKTDGTYRLYFDFTPSSAQKGSSGAPLGVTLSENILVGDSAKNMKASLTDESKIKTVDKFKVTMNPTFTVNEIPENKPEQKIVSGAESKLTFQIEAKDGRPIEHVEKYLGELGHLVILKENTLEYIHAHPVQSKTGTYNRVPFAVSFPEAGKYKLFLEFKYAGKVYMVDYNVTVDQGTQEPSMDHQERMTH